MDIGGRSYDKKTCISIHIGKFRNILVTMGVRGHSPGRLREAQGGWRRGLREAGGGGSGGRLRGGGSRGRLTQKAQQIGDNRTILIAR